MGFLGFGGGCLGIRGGCGGGWGSASGPSRPLALAPVIAPRWGEGVCWWAEGDSAGGLGSLSFCEGRFASFAVVGPFSNGPYGWRFWCSRTGSGGGVGIAVWGVGIGSPSGPSSPACPAPFGRAPFATKGAEAPPFRPAPSPGGVLCTICMDGYCWRPSSRDPPFSFGHFPRERGKPWRFAKVPRWGEGDFSSPPPLPLRLGLLVLWGWCKGLELGVSREC